MNEEEGATGRGEEIEVGAELVEQLQENEEMEEPITQEKTSFNKKI
ncbi:hypothetical protein GCM10010954_31730 [Halobacillus andaensis]|uniref:Uncharacterized protein n=1 Tax=Halobacillus andaensis TaxID=1176239 RepID=A0A917B9S8_HALAA|nr:hypothetical protein [Halobacillus andaensis]MBP2005279.1 putative phage infection (PIP) family protein YhgE [Halobacillus andaensis]GGF30255.1 hypothetical protein GCM10010954_31730 [Halobacillus andaensis]